VQPYFEKKVITTVFETVIMLRVVNTLPSPEGFDHSLLQSPIANLDPLYVRLRGFAAALLVRALRAAGLIGAEEAWLLESFLVERGEGTVPLAAALAPRSWRELLYIAGYCQEAGPGKAMFLPHPALALVAVASLEPGKKVLVEAEGAEPSLFHPLAPLYDVTLAYRSPPQFSFDSYRLDRRRALVSLPRGWDGVPAMQRYFDYDQTSIEVEAPFASSGRPGLVVWRQRREDLLRLAFPTKHALVKGFLREFQTGAAEERSVLEWLRAAELSVSDYLRLVDYGFLRRAPHPAGVTTSLTEKALWVLSLGES